MTPVLCTQSVVPKGQRLGLNISVKPEKLSYAELVLITIYLPETKVTHAVSLDYRKN